MYKRTVEFVDKNHQKFVVEIEITIDGRLTMNSESGQGKFEPSTDAQTELRMIWDKYHLNDMKAGTPKQMKALASDEFKKFSEWHKDSNIKKTRSESLENHDYYTLAKAFLRSKGLEPDGDYSYGSAWLTEELPESIQDRIDTACDTIEEEEEERKGESVKDWTDEALLAYINEHCSFASERDNELAAALVRMFDLCVNDFDDIEIDDNRCKVQGTDYLAGTDDEMDVEWEADLDSYLENCVYPDLPGNMQMYFNDDKWKSDAKMDGRANSLNHYDGNEESCKINDTEYYAYRQ